MAFVNAIKRRRLLITGETGTGKTRSLRTAPGPKYIMMFPGEKGQDTLLAPDGTPLDADTTVRAWEHDTSKSISSSEIIEAVRKEALAARQIAGLVTFCGDGYHKLYEYVIDALSGGEYFAGSQWKTESKQDTAVVDPRVSAQAEHWMADFISSLCLSRIPNVILTGWDKDMGVRKAKMIEGKKEKWTDIPTYKMPALYSGAARKILGEFGMCVHSSVIDKRVEVKPGRYELRRLYRWQTKPSNDVGACSIKCDDKILEKIPQFINQDWEELVRWVDGRAAGESA